VPASSENDAAVGAAADAGVVTDEAHEPIVHVKLATGKAASEASHEAVEFRKRRR
jgi:hypothetical protein